VEPVLIVVGLLIVVAVVYFLFIRKPPAPPEIEAPPKPGLPEKPSRDGVAGGPKPRAPAEPKPAEAPALPKAAEKPLAKEPAPAPPKPAPSTTKPAAEPAAPKTAEASPHPGTPSAPPPAAEAKPAAPPPISRVREPAPVSARKPDVEGLRKGLGKVRASEGLFGRLKALFLGKKEVDTQLIEQMEEVLLTSDVGVQTTETLLRALREGLKNRDASDPARVWQALGDEAVKVLGIGGGGLRIKARPTVVMVVGVNGVGKTTTIGKLATKLKAQGQKVVLAAGDTFRAAAVQQLEVWGKRVGCEVVSGKDGANPGAVIFDAIQRAKEIQADVVLVDTAGRLHTKTNLMEELTKVARTMAKALDGAPHETLLVLDATNGQNALQQAAMFKESLPLSGIVLTKLDGTAKGGVILGICSEHRLPVLYIGLGERAEDLRDFDAEEFVEAMLGQGAETADAAA
jgi:fused signal recognition particle receptor